MTLAREAVVAPPLAELERRLDREVRSIGAALDDPALRAALERAAAGGARVRPRLVLAAHRAWSGGEHPTDAVWEAALAYELLHASFVVHDDVIDDDWERRGAPNPQAMLRDVALRAGVSAEDAAGRGRAGAVIVGDVLLHAATARLFGVRGGEAQVDRLRSSFTRAVHLTAAGEWLDVLSTHDTPAERIAQAVRDKTASYTFAGPLVAGIALAGADDAACAAADAVGILLGNAYQLCDDLIGAFGDAELAGRPAGADLLAGRTTSLVAAARGSEMWPRVQEALGRVRDAAGVREVRLLLERCGARAAVTSHAEALVTDACRRAADELPLLAPVVERAAAALSDRMPHD